MENLLDDKNLIEGIRKCLVNAESLIKDAFILKENNSIERAYTLFQLSIEELGKASMVYFFATSQDSEKLGNLKIFKKDFHSHKAKTTKAINFDAVLLSSIKEKSERHKFLYSILLEHENLETFNDLKNYSLYTSIIKDKFLLPSEIITQKHLEEIEIRATTRFDLVKSGLNFLLDNFDEIKNANIEIDDQQIKAWADEFLVDLLKQE
jgi:AbiV family abortive infection protein